LYEVWDWREVAALNGFQLFTACMGCCKCNIAGSDGPCVRLCSESE
jgi:hypothetical protein